MANELKPCPFCNSTDVSVNRSEITCMSWVSCTSCGLETPSETGVTDEQAISYWNTRHAPPVEGLETFSVEMKRDYAFMIVDPDGDYVTRSQAEAIIAAKDEKIHDMRFELLNLLDKEADLEADKAALTARVKELELSSKHSADVASNAIADMKSLETQLAAARKAARAAHDTLIEITPSNYNHDDVCQMNDASVEAIFLLADVLGETHGKTAGWWELRRSSLEDRP